MNFQDKPFAFRVAYHVINNLVDTGVLGTKVSDTEFRLGEHIVGLDEKTTYKSKDELVIDIANRYADQLRDDPSLKLAA